MRFLGVIPARYESTRFPGKPLVDIRGKTMIRRTWEQAKKALTDVVVATDDERIEKNVKNFGGDVIMTSTRHTSGTERCAEAVDGFSKNMGITYDVVINIQGDEPFIHPRQIKILTECFKEPDVDLATLVKKIDRNEDIFNPNLPKVVLTKNWYAIYFSRSPIPYYRGIKEADWLSGHHSYFRHIGMYGYKTRILQEITKLQPSPLETAESLEQNRWIENGYNIKLKETDLDTISIDTPDDLEKIAGYQGN